jgi:hypothetical protein
LLNPTLCVYIIHMYIYIHTYIHTYIYILMQIPCEWKSVVPTCGKQQGKCPQPENATRQSPSLNPNQSPASPRSPHV